jgi:hypothetical protein
MTIEIIRRYVPLADHSEWERREYSKGVWNHRAGETRVFPDTPIEGYTRGLLVPYVDGNQCQLHTLDAALRALGLTRADVERAIQERSK